MARYIDVDAFGNLVGDEEGKVSISELGRRLVKIRQGQNATDRQEDNARRQIQKWMSGQSIGDLNVKRLSQALGADPDTFLKPVVMDGHVEPVGLMREALANQAENRRETAERLAEIHTLLEALVNGQTAMIDVQTRLLELFQAERSRRRASPEQ